MVIVCGGPSLVVQGDTSVEAVRSVRLTSQPQYHLRFRSREMTGVHARRTDARCHAAGFGVFALSKDS